MTQQPIPGPVATTTVTPDHSSSTSQASGLLHDVLNKTVGHFLTPLSSGIVSHDLNTTTQAPSTSSGHSLSPSSSSVSEMVTEVTSPSSGFNVTIATSLSSSSAFPVTGLTNMTSDTHSLSPHELAQDQEQGFLMHGIILQTVLILGLVALLFGLVYVLRKKHLDRLRHHLMPVYNFDPSDDGEDWETELLDDQFVHCPPTDAPATLASGQLKLDTGLTRGLRIQNNNSSSSSSGSHKSMSPTAMSGLLSSGGDSGSSARRMYTNERNPVA